MDILINFNTDELASDFMVWFSEIGEQDWYDFRQMHNKSRFDSILNPVNNTILVREYNEDD